MKIHGCKIQDVIMSISIDVNFEDDESEAQFRCYKFSLMPNLNYPGTLNKHCAYAGARMARIYMDLLRVLYFAIFANP